MNNTLKADLLDVIQVIDMPATYSHVFVISPLLYVRHIDTDSNSTDNLVNSAREKRKILILEVLKRYALSSPSTTR